VSGTAVQTQVLEENVCTLEDGVIVFHPDGSTTVSIKIPAGPAIDDADLAHDAQYNRLDDRLQKLAEIWHEGDWPEA
jgi:hypothetical protein